jgi:hypothetical protein
MEELASFIWYGGAIAELGPAGFKWLWKSLQYPLWHYFYSHQATEQDMREAASTLRRHAEVIEEYILKGIAPANLSSPNLHVLTCRLLAQELARGPAANESEYYMERYMLEPKRRNAHRTTANPEITHLRHTEMPERALLRCAVQYGCKSLDDLAPTEWDRAGGNELYDPAPKVLLPRFPSKGTRVEADAEVQLFLSFAREHAEPNSFWACYVQHQDDAAHNPSPVPDGFEVLFVRFKDCELPGFKGSSVARAQPGHRRQAASACVEAEVRTTVTGPGAAHREVLKSVVVQVQWFGMLAVWNPITAQILQADRFAYVLQPRTQGQVLMGGVNVFTCVMVGGGGPEDSLAVPLQFIQGPLIVLKP